MWGRFGNGDIPLIVRRYKYKKTVAPPKGVPCFNPSKFGIVLSRKDFFPFDGNWIKVRLGCRFCFIQKHYGLTLDPIGNVLHVPMW